jgi:hypothetical protein
LLSVKMQLLIILLHTDDRRNSPRIFSKRVVLIPTCPIRRAGVTGNRPYVISVMMTYLRHERDGGEAIIRIFNAAYQMFDRQSRASESGRVISPRDTGDP